MTVKGTVRKTAILLTIVAVAAFNSFSFLSAGMVPLVPLVLVGAIGGFVVAMFTIAKPRYSPYTAPIYALLEGAAVGAVTFLAESAQPGIALPTVSLTFAALGSMLFLWRVGLIKVNALFRQIVLVSLLSILVVYLGTLLLTLAGFPAMWLHHHPFINGFAILVASLCLAIDFEQIKDGVKRRAPAYMEWYGAFGLVVTLVWLYLELLQMMGSD